MNYIKSLRMRCPEGLPKEFWELLIQESLIAIERGRHGDLEKWEGALSGLPSVKPSYVDFTSDAVVIGTERDCSNEQQSEAFHQLMQLHPWRKGPFDLLGIHIDTEWRSDFKWRRLVGHISSLQDRLVLDVGCGNGYHCWRMAGVGARFVLGIDPTLLFFMQFRAIEHFAPSWPVQMLPLALEGLGEVGGYFHTIFSMGVLYHRRSPLDHLIQLRDLLVAGGELVLETLVVEGDESTLLIPEGRYARMRNVWFLPSCDMLLVWLKRCGFVDCRVVDVNITSFEEQRSTPWMQFESLRECLNPDNPELTLEGLPAPRRALIIANRP